MTRGDEYDVLVIGGGINGAGIARDAAGRGWRVALCEQGDLANYTSSASTKLIHGGLRYLEHGEFGLVRKALRERAVLLRIAPHIVWPLRLVMPHVRGLRPAWMIRAGLFLYDHLGGRRHLPASGVVRLQEHPAGAALDPALQRGFVFSDCWVQDARLVVLNAMDAAARGAAVWPRSRCVGAERGDGCWRVRLRSAIDGREQDVRARALVNAAGPWVGRLAGDVLHDVPNARVTLVKGSHIVVPRLHDCGHAYLFQHTDGRVVFAIPYERDYTLIGTTEVAYEGDPAAAEASDDEVRYLCEAVSRYLARPVVPDDVVRTYAGVRPLHDAQGGDASALSRDYALRLEAGSAPLLTVLGGKLTTYRVLAEDACARLARVLGGSRTGWTATAPLPGGDLPGGDFDAFLAALRRRYPWLPQATAWRMARNYGTRAERILGAAQCTGDLGEHFGADLYEAELDYVVRHEWAHTVDDVLWRRSKLGLVLDEQQRERAARWLEAFVRA